MSFWCIPTAVLEPESIKQFGVDLISTLCKRESACPRFMQGPHHNPLSTALSLNTGDDAYGPDLLNLIRSTTQGWHRVDPRAEAKA